MSEKYNSKVIEKKWQSHWSDQRLFESKIIELGIDEIFNKYNLSDHGISRNFEKRV